MNLDPPRDRLDFWVRFACGTVFGTLLGLLLFWRVLPSVGLSLATLAIGGLLFGLGAAYWGDSFWHFLLGLFRWW